VTKAAFGRLSNPTGRNASEARDASKVQMRTPTPT